METEAEMAYNKGRQTVIRMLGKMELISATSNTIHYKITKNLIIGVLDAHESYCRLSQVRLWSLHIHNCVVTKVYFWCFSVQNQVCKLFYMNQNFKAKSLNTSLVFRWKSINVCTFGWILLHAMINGYYTQKNHCYVTLWNTLKVVISRNTIRINNLITWWTMKYCVIQPLHTIFFRKSPKNTNFNH